MKLVFVGNRKAFLPYRLTPYENQLYTFVRHDYILVLVDSKDQDSTKTPFFEEKNCRSDRNTFLVQPSLGVTKVPSRPVDIN